MTNCPNGGSATLPGGTAGFTASSASVQAIPTLSDWGTILLMVGLLSAGMLHLRRRATLS
ncbi:MAG: IPTL-CTERM sorting domain-containing protein [Acidobacteria bacterium]|nr:IPTL-CTERM sorting domain-containing protein [Acidobacteriota bacterium]